MLWFKLLNSLCIFGPCFSTRNSVAGGDPPDPSAPFVFEQDGQYHLYDPEAGESRPICETPAAKRAKTEHLF